MFDSPLRYPGGKGRLSQYVIDLIEMNDLVGGHYVEPYAGGAGIAISLLYLEYASHIHLNDLDTAVHAFWRSVLDYPEEMARLVRDTPLTLDERLRQKAIYRDQTAGTLQLGFATFYLNRTNRSGIIHGGVIGGNKQAGTYRIDARYNRADLSRRVEKIASYAPRISLYNKDAVDLIESDLKTLGDDVLIYLDPPYYANGSRLYRNTYKHDDHAKIAQLVSSITQPWIVSYDNAEPIRSFYARYRQQTFGLRYSANAKYEGTEVMVFCDGLKTPGEVEPWRGIAA
ncbi:MAG TPA: DNA adenine methylase [Caulobacteraceae bacterium]|jgi:DNA adenine methylase|nr:DNA adenine methylase [Caulobacteraceae bacterium]